MINYDALWETMKKKNVSQYVLINKYNISRGLIHRLKNNESVTTNSIDMLCEILDCDVQDVMTCSREKKE
ncbi:MAG: helix-turn-helix transcriptional regulator [Agathobacter sp.]|nr:helix-turn-helix transcriptional regulator [Agathobacter sp.]